jgi:glucosamine-6-phosphate deaminase
MTRLVVVADEREGGEVAAAVIADRLRGRESFVLGVATGSTPLTTWSALARRRLDLTSMSAFALDEYVGLAAGHPESYESVVAREIVEPLGLDPALVHVPTSHGVDPHTAAAQYEQRIVEAGGVDLQVVGIGRNGHIAFNEPGSALDSVTRVARLSPETRRDNARFFASIDDVPTLCITQGVGTIVRARTLVLLAFGWHKAQTLAAALEGPVSPDLPASVVQAHPDALVISDARAAAYLSPAYLARASSHAALADRSIAGL